MNIKKNKLKSLLSIIISILVVTFNALIIAFPREMIAAAKEGITLSINNVVPSLLPFVIGTNILMGLGVINFIGTLLGPLMLKIFNIPGIGGFAIITGMTSGYPMGSKVVSTIRESQEITKVQAQRLISFSNNSGPLFILGAVGLGMFKNPSVGYFIMIIHYTAALITGFLFRYYKRDKNEIHKLDNKNILKKAYVSMKKAREKDGRNFGQLLGDSIAGSMISMLNIAGFITIFCVLVAAVRIVIFPLLYTFNMSSDFSNNFILGLIEVTNGAKLIASENFTKASVLGVASLISFGGFSIHAQSINFISKTDINIYIYILSKAIHSVITLILGFLLFPFFRFSGDQVIEVFNIYNASAFDNFLFSSMIFIASLTLVFILALFASIKKRGF